MSRFAGFIAIVTVCTATLAFAESEKAIQPNSDSPELSIFNHGVLEACLHTVKHINTQNYTGYPFSFKSASSAQVAVGVSYNVSLTVDTLPFQLTLIDGFEWRLIPVPKWPVSVPKGVVPNEQLLQINDAKLLRFPSVRVRGPLELTIDAPATHSIRLKMPREVDLIGMGPMRHLVLDEEVDVSIKGAVEIVLNDPVEVDMSLKETVTHLASALRKAMRSTRRSKLMIREPLEIVSLNPSDRFKVKRNGISGVDIKRALPTLDGHQQPPQQAQQAESRLAVKRAVDPMIEALTSESVLAGLQSSIEKFYQQVSSSIRKKEHRLTRIERASAKAVIGYRFELTLLDKESQPSEWEALLIKTFDGYLQTQVARKDDPSQVLVAHTMAPWLLMPNGTDVFRIPLPFPSIGSTIARH
mmetsp:Transcript_1538/g.2339  ORF Transcript_1538/g.2339 Transcript_1538/m.2339 type:complete len:413 (-) Transcript_1538:14-1252(-)|eukprot:CAMPEP_0184369662 /NCGR_PEP_ID=MMETSP1089-20130417/162369_1 /TAXON_ID=38269 ORGANISM="Gloeochaete wittrockiana, Strain SAG46.84" /NCGR_SAMPLE_ID=MMETSP1089 /ASSEMBLY_ACC=CAM_ASM_000445 /LENGTH=412 /DNA_ID=CAMNT_0026712139 /DNA_START=1849 /DNA_END=3087 /DNA_ORIENTATION=+